MQLETHSYSHFIKKPPVEGPAIFPFPEDKIDKRNMPKASIADAKSKMHNSCVSLLVRPRIQQGTIPISPLLNSGVTRDGETTFMSRFERSTECVICLDNRSAKYAELARKAFGSNKRINVLDDDFETYGYDIAPGAQQTWLDVDPSKKQNLRFHGEEEELQKHPLWHWRRWLRQTPPEEVKGKRESEVEVRKYPLWHWRGLLGQTHPVFPRYPKKVKFDRVKVPKHMRKVLRYSRAKKEGKKKKEEKSPKDTFIAKYPIGN